LEYSLKQVNRLLVDNPDRLSEFFNETDRYHITRSLRDLSELLENYTNDIDDSWLTIIDYIIPMVINILEQGLIEWLILVDQSGNELYAKFTRNKNNRYKSLLGMALSGVQTLMNELTDQEVRQIDQQDGSILIERDDLFSLIAMVRRVTPAIKNELKKFSAFIRRDLGGKLDHFSGNIQGFDEILNRYIERNMTDLFFDPSKLNNQPSF